MTSSPDEELQVLNKRVKELEDKKALKSDTYVAMKARYLALERKRTEVTEGLEDLAQEWPMPESTACKDLNRTLELESKIREFFPRYRHLIVKWTWKEITSEEQLELDSLNQQINAMESERRLLNPTLTDLMIESAGKHYQP